MPGPWGSTGRRAADPLFRRHRAELLVATNCRGFAPKQFPLLGRVKEVNEWEIAIGVDAATHFGTLPEFVVLSTPADEGPVEAADAEVRAPGGADAGAAPALHYRRRA